MKDLRSNNGFTLIEIMIAMAILAVISILSAQTMRAGIQDRETVSNEIASDSKVSDAMRIIRTDINSAYHYRDVFVTVMNNAEKPDKPVAGQPTTAPAPGAPPVAPPVSQPVNPASGAASTDPAPTPRPTPPQVTGFIGDAESLYFTTLSNERTIQDSQVSDQAKIGYFIKGCKTRVGSKTIEVKCLYRSLSPYLDEQVEKPGDETVLLENVEQFKLRYLGPGHGTSTDLEYVDSWKTGKYGDATTKDNFPYAVEVTLLTSNKDDKKAKKVTASALIPIRFPNNPPKKADGSPGTEEDAAAQANQDQAGTTGQPGSFNQGVGGQGAGNPAAPLAQPALGGSGR